MRKPYSFHHRGLLMAVAVTIALVCVGTFGAFAQKCDKYPISPNASTFEEITQEYYNLLMKEVGPYDTKLPSFLDKLAACWIKRVSGMSEFQSYQIDEYMVEDYPELVFLIMHSKSISDPIEKQEWFDLYVLMNDEQLLKLKDILVREAIKLYNIDRKNTTDNNGLLVNSTFQYVGYENVSTQNGFNFDFWKLVGDMAENDSGISIPFDSLHLLPAYDSFTADKYGDKHNAMLAEIFHEKYQEYVKKYLTNVKLGKCEIPTERKAQNVILDYWSSLTTSLAEERKKYDELYELTSFPLEEQLSHSGVKEKRLFYLISSSRLMEKYGETCDAAATLVKNFPENFRTAQDFLHYTFYPVLCNNQDKNSRLNIENALINVYQTNDDDILKTINEDTDDISMMLMDCYLAYGQNDTLKNIVGDIKERYQKRIDNHEWLGDNCDESQWYLFLNKAYCLGKFEKEFSYNDLVDTLENRKFHTPENLLEYGCYYCLYRMIHYPQFDANIVDILQKLQQLCVPGTETYAYIEKSIVDNLFKRLLGMDRTVAKVIQPKITVVGKKEIVSEEKNVRLVFYVAQGSYPFQSIDVTLSKADNSTTPLNYSMQDDGVNWFFNNTVTVTNGRNTVSIVCEDEAGNVVSDSIIIDCQADEFENRRNLALLFAVNQYGGKTGQQTLRKPIQDAEDFAAHLTDFGFETVIARNPTRQDVYDTLKKYCKGKGQLNGTYDQLLVFYAGHGFYDKDDNMGYMILSDADTSQWESTLLSYADFADRLDNLQCPHILFISDACHSGSFIKQTRGGQQPANTSQEENMRKHTSRLFIGSSLATETTYDESIMLAKFLNLFDKAEEQQLNYYDLVATLSKGGQEKVSGRFGKNIDESGSFYFNRIKKKGKRIY